MRMTVEKVGDLVLLKVEDHERTVTVPLETWAALQLGGALVDVATGGAGNALNLLDVPGGIDR
jgi:hypothetical protein